MSGYDTWSLLIDGGYFSAVFRTWYSISGIILDLISLTWLLLVIVIMTKTEWVRRMSHSLGISDGKFARYLRFLAKYNKINSERHISRTPLGWINRWLFLIAGGLYLYLHIAIVKFPDMLVIVGGTMQQLSPSDLSIAINFLYLFGGLGFILVGFNLIISAQVLAVGYYFDRKA